jgi:lipoate---protein ligase
LVEGLATVGGSPPVTWKIERSPGSAMAFHQREFPEPMERAVWIHDIDRPALVLGSSQPETVVRRQALGEVELVRRRSGGGAVLLVPGEVLWLDVLIPVGDALWHDDIGRASHWLGQVWATAIGGDAVVHRGAMVRSAFSSLVCFAGVGPGEVLVGQRKVVGLSQRRTRNGARFQCAAYSMFDAQAITPLLELDAADATELSRWLQDSVGTVAIDPEALLRRVLGLLEVI